MARLGNHVPLDKDASKNATNGIAYHSGNKIGPSPTRRVSLSDLKI
jgi:hypothetical protein